MNKKALSFVEILVSVAIIALLATVWLSYKNSYDDNKFNAKVESDLATLNNSFLSYKQENSSLPTAKSNDNFFKKDSSYAHDENDNAYWVHGYVTDNLIPKKYLNYLPLDPRTNQYYAYWKTLDPKNLQFEFAWVLVNDWEPESIVSGNFDWKALVGLIREYNWPQFIYDQSTKNFPYNPEERLMTAKIGSYSWNVTVTIDWNDYSWDKVLEKILKEWDKITVSPFSSANIYYSDGSRSILEDDSELVLTNMKYKSDNNLLTQIKLNLNQGSMWTKATKLNPDWSEFEVTAQDTTAAVRWTIFEINNNKISVVKWRVEITKETTNSSAEVTENKVFSTSDLLEIPETPSFTDTEITLPSNIKPEITEVDWDKITISQAKDWYYIKWWECNSNWNCSCHSTWWNCDIEWNPQEIQLCTKIWIEKEVCSEKIKINNEIAYQADLQTEEERILEELEEQQNTETDEENQNNCENITKECDWTLPDHIEVGENYFLQTCNENGELTPESKNWTYTNSISLWECEFTCENGYTYDENTKECLESTIIISFTIAPFWIDANWINWNINLEEKSIDFNEIIEIQSIKINNETLCTNKEIKKIKYKPSQSQFKFLDSNYNEIQDCTKNVSINDFPINIEIIKE